MSLSHQGDSFRLAEATAGQVVKPVNDTAGRPPILSTAAVQFGELAV